MPEWLGNNDISMYSTHNEGRSVIAERFIRPLKAKIYKKMTANGGKSCLSYFNKLVDEYHKSYNHSINKNLFVLIILFWLVKLRQILKLLSLKLMTELELLNVKIFLIKVTLKIGKEIYLLLNLCWKVILGNI